MQRKPWPHAVLAVLLVLGGGRAPAAAQTQPAPEPSCESLAWPGFGHLTGPRADLQRAAELLSPGGGPVRLFHRPGEPWRGPCREDGAGRASIRTEYNSAYARERDNGPLWSGRGLSTLVSGGGEIRRGILTVAVQPVVAWQENRAFEVTRIVLPGYTGDIYYGQPGQIDWPQRPSGGAFWTIDPGRSYIRLDRDGVAAGVSTANLWWGPAQRYPLLLSDAAPGFPHLFLGASGPLDIAIGQVEGEAVWGRLRESRWFDADAANDHRLFGGLIATFRPSPAPNIRVGAAHVRVRPLSRRAGVSDYILAPFGGWGSEAIAMTSVFARWILPRSGFEIYGEVIPSDYHWGETLDDGDGPTLDRSMAYVFGLGKTFDGNGYRIHVRGELLQLQNRISLRTGEPTVTYYVDSDVVHGYTHAGQMLGAATGPGSEAQTLGADLFARWGSVGLAAERVVYNDDAYFEQHAYNFGYHGHDVEVSLRLRQTLLLGPLDLFWAGGPSYRWNRHFVGLGPARPGFEPRTDVNWNGVLGLSWRS